MDPKKLLYAVLVAALVVLAVAVPVLAEGDIPMWVQRARLAYVGRNCSCPDRMVAMVHIRDATKSMVAGALVTVNWTVPYSDEEITQKAQTNSQGIAEFDVPSAVAGDYVLCIDAVTAAERTYDPGLDREVCPVITAY
jgi:hypothetical protein